MLLMSIKDSEIAMSNHVALNELRELLEECKGTTYSLKSFVNTWKFPEHAYLYPNRHHYYPLVIAILNIVDIFDANNKAFDVNPITGKMTCWSRELSDDMAVFVVDDNYEEFLQNVIDVVLLKYQDFCVLSKLYNPEGEDNVIV